MKINHLQNGDIVIVFSKNEIEHIGNTKKQPLRDNFISMQDKCRDFIDELYSHFGNKEFKLSDKKVTELRKKHFIVDVSQLLTRLQKRNMIEIRYTNFANAKRKRILSVNFKTA